MPSTRAVAAGLAWLTAAQASIWLPGPPVWVGIPSSVLLAILGLPFLWSMVALKGPRAITGLEWPARDRWLVRLGPEGRRLPAHPTAGSQHLAGPWWLLRFETPEGPRAVLLDADRYDEVSIRHLSRCLAATMRSKA